MFSYICETLHRCTARWGTDAGASCAQRPSKLIMCIMFCDLQELFARQPNICQQILSYLWNVKPAIMGRLVDFYPPGLLFEYFFQANIR